MSQRQVQLYGPNNKPLPRTGPSAGPKHMPQISPWNPARPLIERHPIAVIQEKYQWARDAGRELYWTYKLVRGVVNEIARHVGADMTTTFVGRDQSWGEIALNWLRQHDQRIDTRGRGYSARRLRQEIVRSALTDGEFGLMLSRAPSTGSPKVQALWGDFCDTPIFSTSGQVLGYKINGSDIPADDLLWMTIPGFEVQGRGLSPIGLARFEWMDLAEYKLNELAGARAYATRTLKVTNATGEPEERKFDDDLPETNTTAPKVIYERLAQAGIEYIRAGEGANVEGFDGLNRPSPATQEFVSREIREHFFALGWNIGYALDQDKFGGASIRVSSDRVRGTAGEYFDELISAPFRRIDAYRLSVAAKLGEIPEPPDTDHLFAFARTGGQVVTADQRYRVDTDEKELRLGLTTKSRVVASRGGETSFATILDANQQEAIAELESRNAVYQEAVRLSGGEPEKLQWLLNQRQATN